MKKIFYSAAVIAMVALAASCGNRAPKAAETELADSTMTELADSTVAVDSVAVDTTDVK